MHRLALFLACTLVFAQSSPRELVLNGRVITPEQARELERIVEAQPANAQGRMQLLGYYLAVKDQQPAEAAARALAHFKWMVENDPASDLFTTTDVATLIGPQDYQEVRDLWLEQTRRLSNVPQVLWNAGMFLRHRDTQDGFELLRRAYESAKASGASLSHPYGVQLALGVVSVDANARAIARAELERSIDPAVCAAAASLIGHKLRGGARVEGAAELEQFARSLYERAISAAPNNAAAEAYRQALADLTEREGKRIRVAGQVQAAKLVKSAEAAYPPLARQARIQGTVRFNAVIGRDGTVQNLTLISGHPLMVQAAQDAVRQYVYQPTLLNGEPVSVVTTVDVEFRLPPQ